MKVIGALILLSLFPLSTFAANEVNQSFSKAKKLLETKVYQNNRVHIVLWRVI